MPLEIDADFTVRQVKEQIEKDHGLKADLLKLIHYGKVLDNDEKKASDFQIKENDFIVAMVQKPKPVPKAKEEVKKEEEPAKVEQPAQS